MKKVFLCTPHKLGKLNHTLIERITKQGFEVLCAVTHSPQDAPKDKMFQTNVDLIRAADIFIAVLKDYGKDLTAEVGMAYAWKMPSIGVDFEAKDTDVMCYYALDKIIKPEDLEKTLLEYK
jgi:nucleoside 2-deoxyribosyltransferase